MCKSPGNCICNEGYEDSGIKFDAVGKICTPKCDPPCENSMCVEPNRCVCNAGYENVSKDNKCTPTCVEGCENGNCVSPNKCECNAGMFNKIIQRTH